MSSRVKFLILSASLFFLIPIFCSAESSGTGGIITLTPNIIKPKAVIDAENNVEVNKNIIFDASSSQYNQGKKVKITWNLGDGTIIEGREIVHTYKTPGKHIVRLTIEQEAGIDHTERFVYVYEKIIILISNISKEKESINKMIEEAKKSGVFIKLIDDFVGESGAVSEEMLIKKLNLNIEDFKKANNIVVWPEKTIDFSVLTNFYQDNLNKNINYKKKTFIFITSENLNNVGNFTQNIYEIIKPKQIIITRKQALPPLYETENTQAFLSEIEKRLLDYVVVDASTKKWEILNIFSNIIKLMLEKGIPSNTIILILILPLITTIIAFSRQIIGIATFGVYTPSIITLSLIALGLKFGLIILALIVLFGTLTRICLKKFRLLYISKVAIILTISSIIIFLLMAMGAYFEIGELTTIAVFPMLIMTTLGEKFISIQSEKGLKSAFLVISETTIVAICCYFIVTWETIQTAIISYPGIMFIFFIILNIMMGRYTGLRLSEYVRFRALFEHMEE